MICEHGMLSGDQLRIEMQQGNILICPFEKSQLTPLGYNLTASDFVFSTRRNILLDVKFQPVILRLSFQENIFLFPPALPVRFTPEYGQYPADLVIYLPPLTRNGEDRS